MNIFLSLTKHRQCLCLVLCKNPYSHRKQSADQQCFFKFFISILNITESKSIKKSVWQQFRTEFCIEKLPAIDVRFVKDGQHSMF